MSVLREIINFLRENLWRWPSGLFSNWLRIGTTPSHVADRGIERRNRDEFDRTDLEPLSVNQLDALIARLEVIEKGKSDMRINYSQNEFQMAYAWLSHEILEFLIQQI